MEKTIQNNLICDHICNGFRIKPFAVSSSFCWSITPNFTYCTFYFAKLSCAEVFCHKYINNHKDAFWFNLWHKNPIYHLVNVKKISNDLLFLL